MKRTTIVLSDELAALLDWERRRRGVSAAAVVRDALDAHLNRPTGPLSFIGIGRSEQRDTAERAEEILDEEWSPYLLEEMGRSPEETADAPNSDRRRDRNVELARPSDAGGPGEDGMSLLTPPRPDGDGRLSERSATPQDVRARGATPTDPRRAVANDDGERP
jgi:hypothetical protein